MVNLLKYLVNDPQSTEDRSKGSGSAGSSRGSDMDLYPAAPALQDLHSQ